MSRLTRIGGVAAAALAVLALESCATMRVNSYLERGIDFGQYRTYAWGPADPFSTGDPRLDNNRFFRERVQAAVDQQLASRGFEKTGETPELRIHIHARIDQRIESNRIDQEYGRCEDSDCGALVFEAGTLLLDFVDTRTNTLAWRGWAEGSFDGVIDDQDWMEATVDKAVGRILARLPRDAS
jgi:hypothetical protein